MAHMAGIGGLPRATGVVAATGASEVRLDLGGSLAVREWWPFGAGCNLML